MLCSNGQKCLTMPMAKILKSLCSNGHNFEFSISSMVKTVNLLIFDHKIDHKVCILTMTNDYMLNPRVSVVMVNISTIDQGSNSKMLWSFVFFTKVFTVILKIPDLLRETFLIQP